MWKRYKYHAHVWNSQKKKQKKKLEKICCTNMTAIVSKDQIIKQGFIFCQEVGSRPETDS